MFDAKPALSLRKKIFKNSHTYPCVCVCAHAHLNERETASKPVLCVCVSAFIRMFVDLM